MSTLQAAILGAVQGITEFLPVSSHAHLVLVPWIMGWPNPGLTFDVALHLGTLVALLVYFRTEWLELTLAGLNILRGRTKDPHARMAIYIVLATIPGALAGLFLEHLEDDLSTPLVIGSTLIVLALVLWAAEKLGRRKIDLDHISMGDALIIGGAQAIALIPGVSRSGITITAGLFRGLTRDAAARFSFLLSAPIIAGAVAKKALDIARDGLPAEMVSPFAIGIVTAAVVGYASIAILIRYLATHSTFIFIYYRIALGIAVLSLAFWWGFK